MRGLRLLSIEINARGFALAVLEADFLVDWGGREVRGDVSIFLDKLGILIDRYRPDVLVLEEPAGSRRGPLAIDRLAWAEELAGKRGIRSYSLPLEALSRAFAETGTTRHAIAVAVSRQFPELAPYLPKLRKPWQSESARLGVFIAVARAVAAQSDPRLSASSTA